MPLIKQSNTESFIPKTNKRQKPKEEAGALIQVFGGKLNVDWKINNILNTQVTVIACENIPRGFTQTR